jgi:hypothetical protein
MCWQSHLTALKRCGFLVQRGEHGADQCGDRGDDRGVAGKNVVEPLKSCGAAEIGGVGRV